MDGIYLAMYKGSGGSLHDKATDWAIRKFTKSIYSHCEIAFERWENVGGMDYRKVYDCYSSSPRDGGVRCKQINLDDGKWDLIPLHFTKQAHLKAYFERTKHAEYDVSGALGVRLGYEQDPDKFFCSEWCYNVIFYSDQGWRFSPAELAEIVKGANTYIAKGD